MKKIIFSIALLSGMLFASCEDMLEIEQKATSSTATFYKTDEDAESALTAMYARFQSTVASSSWEHGIWNPLLMGLNYSSDDVFAAGGDITDHYDFRIMNEFRYDTKNQVSKYIYQEMYSAIYSANLVIDYFKDADTPIKKQCVAEARVMRAWAHMVLALTFYQPPLVDHLLDASDKPTNVESQEYLLKWCVNECDEVMSILPERKGQSDKEGAFRVTKGFAQFVAGKSAMFYGDKNKAASELKPLVESSNYALVPGNRFRDLFHAVGDGCEEKIMELNFEQNANLGGWGGNINRGRWMCANVLNWRGDDLPGKPNIAAVGGWGGGSINDQFAIKMYANDGDGPRRKATFLTPDEFLYDHDLCGWPADTKEDGTLKTLDEKISDSGRGITKIGGTFSRGIYMEVKMMMRPEDTDMTCGDNCNNTNFCLARLAEAYLLYAEAVMESNNAEGKKYLNAIQTRAEAPVTELTIQTLRDEKQYELWFEGCRFHDIVRWGIAKECHDKVLDNIPYTYDEFFQPDTDGYGKYHKLVAVTKHPLKEAGQYFPFVAGKHEYFPIPQDIIDLNPEMHQVRGWAN